MSHLRLGWFQENIPEQVNVNVVWRFEKWEMLNSTLNILTFDYRFFEILKMKDRYNGWKIVCVRIFFSLQKWTLTMANKERPFPWVDQSISSVLWEASYWSPPLAPLECDGHRLLRLELEIQARTQLTVNSISVNNYRVYLRAAWFLSSE